MKIVYTLIIAATALTTLSCSNNENKTTVDNTPAIKVKVEQVNNNNKAPFLSVSGKIQSTSNADLSTRMMGYVENVYVKVGDKVKKGQLLIKINNNDLQAKSAQVSASITEATAAFKNAEKDYNRYVNLFEKKSVSQKELDDITAHFKMAKARLEAAKQMKNEINAQFNYSNITAPFSGVVTYKTVKEGDMANPGMPLISIESPGDFEVVAMVPETEISNIKTGIPVDVKVKSINTTLKGEVAIISASAKHTGGQYLVKIKLDKTKTNLFSGMFATVQFPVERNSKSDIILIPNDAIITNGQLSGIYTVSQTNTALLRWLRLGRAYGNQVEVLSGLSDNEAYIISSEGKLFNGAKIKVSAN